MERNDQVVDRVAGQRLAVPRGQGLDVARIVGRDAHIHEARRDARSGRGLVGAPDCGPGRGVGALRKQRHRNHASGALAGEALHLAVKGRFAVPIGGAHGEAAIRQGTHPLDHPLGFHPQRRPLRHPYGSVEFGNTRGSPPQHHALQKRLPEPGWQVHHRLVGEEFEEKLAHGLRFGETRRAEIDEQEMWYCHK